MKGKKDSLEKVDRTKGHASGPEDEEVSPRRTKDRSSRRIMKVVLIVVVMVAIIAIALVGFKPKQYISVSDMMGNKEGYVDKEVELRGLVQVDSLDAINRTFVLEDDGDQVQVVYDDILPDSFGEGKEIVATGKLRVDGIFHASKITVGCPSKYN